MKRLLVGQPGLQATIYIHKHCTVALQWIPSRRLRHCQPKSKAIARKKEEREPCPAAAPLTLGVMQKLVLYNTRLHLKQKDSET